jgi:hypothetical protein
MSVGLSTQQTDDGGYVVSGHYYDHIDHYRSTMVIVKTDSTGIESWSRIITEANSGRSIHQTSDGGYLICGYTDQLVERS